MKLLVAFILFLVTVFVGAIGIPFLMWAQMGFPDGDSHGLWIPTMFGFYFGLPGGIILGLIFAGIVFLLPIGKKKSPPPVEKTGP